MHFHHTLDTLKEFVPLELLPEEYGGYSKPISLIHGNLIVITKI